MSSVYISNCGKRLFSIILTVTTLISFLSVQSVQAATIKISASTITIKINETYQLSMMNTKNTVIWSSNDSDIASVNQAGKVNGNNAGTATVTAKIGSKKYTCKVTVLSEEITQAIALGIIPRELQSNYSKTITYKQFCTLLENVLKNKKSSYAQEWRKVAKKALASNQSMSRQEGMLALFYAAEIMGIGSKQSDWDKFGIRSEPINQPWDDFTWDYPLFPDWMEKAYYTQEWDTHMIAAYFYIFGTLDTYTGKKLLDFEDVTYSVRAAAPFTCEEAIRAIFRFYNIYNPRQRNIASDQEVESILSDAKELKESILNSKTNVTYTGTAYYVSNDGDDSNDGLSPETPWASLQRVGDAFDADVKKGDAIFFERGGIWRGHFYGNSGITYSAYGEGPKPKIYGSPENGADTTKWSLLKGTKNIWVFYKDMPDCGLIVFNDTDNWANKTFAYWNGTGYVNKDNHKKPFDVKKINNMTFFSELDLEGYTPPVYRDDNFTGKLYLRCDEGNPGDVFQSIEFLSGATVSSITNDCVLDNLCFMYGADCGLTMPDKNATVQNCEIGWFGGSVLSYQPNGDIIIAGDGIQIYGNNNKAINNYVHDIYDYGLTVETGVGSFYKYDIIKNLTFKNNLVDRCNGGMLVINWEETVNKKHIFKNIVFQENYVMNSGYGWSYQTHEMFNQLDMSNSMMFFTQPNYNDGIYLTNNIFYRAKYSMVFCFIPRQYWPVFSGNTYFQENGKYLLVTKDSILNISAFQKSAEELLGDKMAVLYSY